MKTKIFTLIITVLVNVGFASAWDYEKVLVGDLYYNLDAAKQIAEVTRQGKYTGDITIPSSIVYDEKSYTITGIGESAFFECFNLTSVTIPNSVTSIGEFAFRDCYSLTSIIIPNSVTSIGKSAFRNCNSIISVIIGTNLTDIGQTAFADCTSIKSITWNAKHCVLNSVNQIGFGSQVPSIDCQVESFIFGEEVDMIPLGICSGMNKLTSIVIPNSVTSIGDWAFSNCSSLASITIGNSVTSIGERAFWDCSKLESASLPNSIKNICKEAFLGCTSLQTVILGNSITSIGDYAFFECSNLTSVSLPNTITKIGEYAFCSCSSLESVVLQNSITTIEEGTFSDCTNLKSVTIPQSVTRIKGTFVGAFEECTNLEKILNYGETPANANSKTFDGVNKSTCKLYVPKNSISLYKNAAVWRDFYNVESIEDVLAIDDIEVDDVNGKKVIRNGKVYILRGEKTYTMQGQEAK